MMILRIAMFVIILNISLGMVSTLGIFDFQISESQNATTTTQTAAQDTITQIAGGLNQTQVQSDSSFVENFKFIFTGVTAFTNFVTDIAYLPVLGIQRTVGPYLPNGFLTGIDIIFWILIAIAVVQFVRGQSLRDLE